MAAGGDEAPHPDAERPPSDSPAGAGSGGDALALAGVPEHGDMMARFEALSKMFQCEVEGLLGSQKETAKEDLGRLEERNRQLEAEVRALRAEASGVASSIRCFMADNQGEQLERVFGLEEPGAEPLGGGGSPRGSEPAELADGRLGALVAAFLQVNGADERPEIRQARQQVAELRARAEADFAELARLRGELAEARKLKSQEERDLAEFAALREKESEAQGARLELEQLRCELQEQQAHGRQLGARADQQQALLKEKSDKIIELVRRLEEQSEQVRLLSDENNTLRLELGRDADYSKALPAPADPLSYTCAAGTLSDELKAEEERLREDLLREASKFPGLAPGGNCRRWCEVHIGSVGAIHRSFLHRLQDHREAFPEGVRLELVSQAREAGEEWTQQEELMRQADATFQEAERQHTKQWEEHRLKLTSERDAKVKQLLEQAERSPSTAEKQLLAHQAKLFGDRVDSQVERAWAEQRKERDQRWREHQQQKVEARQKLKDESLSLQQQAEDRAVSSDRFADLAAGKLAGAEDAWLRNADKAAAVSASALKGSDLEEALRSAGGGEEAPRLPARGARHTGIGQVVDAVEEVLRARMQVRGQLRGELEDQSLRQLRSCAEKFVLKEAGDALRRRGALAAGDVEDADPALPEGAQAAAMASLLRMRQHRHLSDSLRRQFQDFLLVLRLASQAALWLMPQASVEALSQGAPPGGRGGAAARRDLPPPPPELRQASPAQTPDLEPEGSEEEPPAGEAPLLDAAAEAESLYNGLCQRILQRALTLVGGLQREELLGLKRAHASEVRVALESLCQLEGAAVAAAVERDLEEFRRQTAARLTAEGELAVGEERRKLYSQVEGDVAVQTAMYRRQLEDAEQASVRERRQWLTERLVVMQANGAAGPADRALLRRLRQELRACDAKLALLDAQRGDEAKAQPPVRAPSVERGGRRSRPSSASRHGRRPSSRESNGEPAPGGPPVVGQPAVPSAPSAPGPGRLPPRPEARSSVRPSRAGAAPAAPREAARYADIDMDMLCSEGPSSLSHQVPSDARQPPPPPGRSLPQFGDAPRPSARDALDFPGPAVAPLERPLYDWPFEPAGPADAAAGGSTPRRHLEAAAPTRQKLLEGSPKGIVANGAEFQALGEAGCSWTPRGSAARMRSTPPLLPPVHTPRG